MAKVMKTIGSEEYPASAFLVVEDSSKPSTWHLRVKDSDGKVNRRLLGAAWAATHKGYRGNKYEGPGKAQAIAKLKKLYEQEGMDAPGSDEKSGKRIRQSMKDKLKAAWEAIKEVMDWAEPEEESQAMAMFGKSSHFDVKQINGKPWFISYSANSFEDREKEIFSIKSLEKYVAEAEQKQDRGYFNFWHIPNSDFAKKEWQAVVGKFLVEAGPFLENAKGQAALKFFTEYPESHPDIAPEGWGSSVEYRYLPEERKSGVYKNIWITRTSALPRLAAANVWTKGTTMLTKEQEQAAKAIFGEDLAKQIISGAEGATKELEDAGVAHKEITTESTPVEIPLDDLAKVVIEKLEADFQPFAEALAALATKVDELTGTVKSLQKTEEIKSKAETPRYVFSLNQRASQAESTVVAEGDKLLEKKPLEKETQDKSGAAAFFPAR